MIPFSYYNKFTGVNEPTEPGYYWVNYKPFPHKPMVITEIVRLEWLNTFESGQMFGLHTSYAGGGPMWVKEFSQYEPALWGPAIPCPWTS